MNPGNPQATIAWGDGSPTSSAAVTVSGSQLSVNGSHTYGEEGGFKGTVTGSYTCSGTLASSTVAFEAGFAATVADAPLTITSAPELPARVTAGQKFRAHIAAFTDADPAGVTSDYTAQVDWGDGRGSSGTVVASGGSWRIIGEHVYATAGRYAVGVRIYDRGGANTKATGFGQVAAGPPRVGIRIEPHIGNGTAVLSLNLTRPGTLTIRPVRRDRELLVGGRRIRTGKAGPLVVVLKPTAAGRRELAHGRALDLKARLAFAPSNGQVINTFIKIHFTDTFCDGSVIYDFTGAEQSCIVPNGVQAVKVIAVGGRGGNVSEPCGQEVGCPYADLGGQGGRSALVVTPELLVHPGETLYIEVGGNGGDTFAHYLEPDMYGTGAAGAGGWNGGGLGQLPGSGEGSGGGGGASDVQTLSCAQLCDQGLGFGAFVTLLSRLVIAGGGGGGGSGGATGSLGEFTQGGSGGDAGWEGYPGFDATVFSDTAVTGAGGGYGFENYGGAGGAADYGNDCNDGANGVAGSGGAGGNNSQIAYVNGGFLFGYAGGGGGGGYAGGGGGGGGCFSQGDNENSGGGGGGGGGSSYGPPGTNAQINMTGEQPHIQIIPLG